MHTYNREKPLIHGDIKSANILLDQCNEPRIGDFGLAREGPHTDYMKVNKFQVYILFLLFIKFFKKLFKLNFERNVI